MKIVVISNWRYGSHWYNNRIEERHNFPQECDNWPTFVQVFRGLNMGIYDVTPWEDSLTNRSEEILDYLTRYSEIESYVILDDCFSDDYSQYPELQERLVFVDANQALQDCDVEKAMGILQDI